MFDFRQKFQRLKSYRTCLFLPFYARKNDILIIIIFKLNYTRNYEKRNDSVSPCTYQSILTFWEQDPDSKLVTGKGHTRENPLE